MSSEERIVKVELHEEITFDDNEEGELMDASFSDGAVKLEDELKKEQSQEFANEIDDNIIYFCERCDSYFPNLSTLLDHMQNHDNYDEDIDIKNLKDSQNVDAMKSTEVKEESGEGKHSEKPDDKQEEKCNEKRQRTKEKDEGINLENDVNENDEHELVNLIMKDHIILRKKHHDVDKASFKIVKEETEDINENYNEELVNLIMKDHIILRTNHHNGNNMKMETEASRNSICEKSNMHAETSNGNNQIDKDLSETRHDTVINVIGDAYGDSNTENATKCTNNTKRRQEPVSKELATENIPPQSPHIMPNLFCDVCQKNYSSKGSLDRHMKQVHLGIKEECKCMFCGKSYKDKSSCVERKLVSKELATENIPPQSSHIMPNLFDCNVCSKSFNTRKKLVIHKYRSHGVFIDRRPAFCDVCQKKFSSKGNLNRHMKVVHLGIKVKCKFCKFCGKGYRDKSSLGHHTNICSKNKNKILDKDINKFKCELCSRRYVSQEALDRHRAKHRKYICDYCDKMYYVRYRLERHIIYIHLKGKYRCKKCGKEYAHLYEHKKLCNKNVPPQSPHMPNQFDCNVCSRSFDTSRNLQMHKYNSHRPAFCDVCQKKFSSKGSLDRHMKQVHLGIKVMCKFCGKGYKDKSCLRHHTNICSKNKNKILDKDINKFKCELCSKRYVSQEALDRHRAKHRKYICDYCDKMYYARYRLERHIIYIHLTSGNLQRHKYNSHRLSAFCDVCQKNFSSKQYLNEHVKRVHLGIKVEYKCQFCGEGYSYKSRLRRHTNKCSKNENKILDKDITKFKCDLCRRKYVSQEMLERHMANHPKYICDYCDKMCYLKDDLKEHIKRVHLKVRYRCKKRGNEYAKLSAHVKSCEKNIPSHSPHMPNKLDCNICSRSFETSRKLYDHNYTTHRRPPAFCDVCQKKFCSKATLNIHVKRIHLGIKETENTASPNQKIDCN